MMGSEDLFVKEYPYENAINTTVDAEKAKEYLALALEELGATVEDVPELSMLCYESPNSQTALQAAQDMFLTTLGINCVIDPQPIQQMIGKVYSFDYDFWWGGLGVGTVDMGSTDGVLSYYSSTNPDALFGYDNAQYNEYFTTATSTLDTKARFDAIAELEKIFCEEVPDLLITWSTSHCVYKSEITLDGGISSSYGADLAFADVAVD
jgi:ABC-type transport system substrate-binding protein